MSTCVFYLSISNLLDNYNDVNCPSQIFTSSARNLNDTQLWGIAAQKQKFLAAVMVKRCAETIDQHKVIEEGIEFGPFVVNNEWAFLFDMPFLKKDGILCYVLTTPQH